MENKKSMKADLENKKHVFLEMGFMVALAALLFAFEWKVSVEESSDYITVSDIPMEVEMVPVTLMSQLPPPPPARRRPSTSPAAHTPAPRTERPPRRRRGSHS